MELQVAIARRRSCRKFDERPIREPLLETLLWAGRGPNTFGKRTAPSAGACYPIRLQIIYDVHICRIKAPVAIVLVADFERMRKRYPKRAKRFVYIEAGHIAQNICLQAIALGLESVCVGAFNAKRVRERYGMQMMGDAKIKDLSDAEKFVMAEPIYIVLVGYEKR